MKTIQFYINEALKIRSKQSGNDNNKVSIISDRDAFLDLIAERYKNMENGILDLRGFKFEGFSNWNSFTLPRIVENAKAADIKHINVDNWDFTECKANLILKDLFSGCLNAESITGFDTWEGTDKIISLEGAFYGCMSLGDVDIFSSSQFQNLTDCTGMFYKCVNLKYIYCSGTFLRNVEKMNQMFYGCKNLETVDFGKQSTDKLVSCETMFYDCQSLKRVDISNWDGNNIQNAACMFCNCTSLEEIGDLQKWKSAPDNINKMFYKCEKLTLDVSHWDYTKSKSQLFNYGVDCNKFKYNNKCAIDYNSLNNKALDAKFESLEDIEKLFADYFKSKFVKVSHINKDTKFYKYNSGYGADYDNIVLNDVIKIRCTSGGDTWELLVSKHKRFIDEVYYLMMLRYQVEDGIQRGNKTREYVWNHTERITLNSNETLLNTIEQIATNRYGGNTSKLFATIFNIK